MSRSRRPAQRALSFDPLETKALLSTTGVAMPAAAAVQVQSNQVAPIQIKENDFEVDGGQTQYELDFVSGRYKFTNDYEMEIDQIKGRNPHHDFGITAVDAMSIFYDQLYTRLGYGVGVTAAARARELSAQQDEGEAGYQITKEKFRHRGGKLTYELDIESGAYEFEQDYTFNLKRVNRGPNNGMTAYDALDFFAESLFIKVENFLIHRDGPLPGQMD